MARSTRRIEIELYDHTTDEEIRDILGILRGVGIDNARLADDVIDAELQELADELGIELPPYGDRHSKRAELVAVPELGDPVGEPARSAWTAAQRASEQARDRARRIL